MKLYLSSLTVPGEQALLDLLPTRRPLRVAVIPNAGDIYSGNRQALELEMVSDRLAAMGLSPTTVDLSKYVEEALGDELPKYGVVYVMGGNTFHLNDLMQRSGFHDLIRPLLVGGVVYAGESAGAVIAGPTLRGVQHLDDPAEAEHTVWRGLDLIDVGVVPHWGNEKFAEALEQCRDEMAKDTDVITITDSQVLVVDGERRKIL